MDSADFRACHSAPEVHIACRRRPPSIARRRNLESLQELNRGKEGVISIGSPTMDHQLFRGDRRREGDRGVSGQMELGGAVRRRNASRNSREATQSDVPTVGAPPVVDDMAAQDDSFSELPGNSLSSFATRSSSWESNSISGEGEETPSGAASKDRRSYVDVTTPTLVDEFDEEEEAEMVSLEQERLRRSHTGVMPKDESHLRRTPGANMYASTFERSAALRRTPGASAMHRSAVNSAVVKPAPEKSTGDGSILGFGLTLSTPVAGEGRSAASKPADGEEQSLASSASSVSAAVIEERATSQEQASRPPLAPNAATQGRDMYSYTTAGLTLSKNPNLEFSRGAFSPNTIRLTESLDNLLLDDEDNADPNSSDVFEGKSVFRANMKKPTENQTSSSAMFNASNFTEDDVSESWAKSYIIESEGGSATASKTSKTGNLRSRRGRNDNTSKRTKSFSGGQGDTGTPFHPQQPKPVRQTHGAGASNKLGVGFLAPTSRGDEKNLFAGDDEDRSSPRPLSFGGAFVPPSKANMQNFKRPVASAVRGPRFEASVAAASLHHPGAQSMHSSSGGPSAPGGTEHGLGPQPFVPSVMHHHYSGFERGPHLAVSSQPFIPHQMAGPMDPSQGPSPDGRYHAHPPAMDYQNHGMGPHLGVSSNSAVGNPSISPYSMTPPLGHPYGQDYLYMQNQQQPSQPFPPPHWGHVVPVPFDATASTAHRNAAWHASSGTGWGASGDFMYGMPAAGLESPHHMPLSPPSPCFPFPENDIATALEPFPPHYSHAHSRVETPDQDMMMQSSLPRPRVRSVDALSPATVPVPQRGRMASWDHGGRDTTYAKGQQRKSAQRRQRQADLTSKTKSQTKSKKNNLADEKFRTSDAASRKKNASGSPKKKKQSKAQVTPLSDSVGGSKQKNQSSGTKKEGSVADGERATPSTDDPAEMKRAELVESPATRLAFKAFYRSFRVKERSSFQEAEEFALQNLRDETLPENVQWRVYLELADLAKRANKFDDARRLYQKVCELQPYASQGWLEYSKLEEECGHLNRCAKILHNGLEHCELSESLLTRAIKHEEKIGNLEHARQLLARLKHVGIEKVWRTVLEGALLEARDGNDVMARRVLKYLMHHVPWYGPLYLEAFRLERDLGRPRDALAIVERGLKAIPRYGPLWFGAFRLCEALDNAEKSYDLPRTLTMFERATDSISRELVWKVHLDAAQILERAAIQAVLEKPNISLSSRLSMSRQRFAKTVLTCPPNLCWKVWLAGGRMELAAGNAEAARRLFLRAYEVVPEKGRAAALLECARLEEFVDNTELARAILFRTRSQIGSDWKVWLESVLLEIRSGENHRAIELAKHALEIHSGTGRLWAALVQLRQVDGEEAQFSALKSALRAVPKSGEVWCEGARVHLNPFSLVFDVEKARQHLFFATKFTPQYGDSFLETLRLEIVDKWILPLATKLWEALESTLTEKPLSEMDGAEIDQFIGEGVLSVVRAIIQKPERTSSDYIVIDEDVILSCRDSLDRKACDAVGLSEVELRCANADPNYGLLWFHCRHGPTDTARVVLARAREKIVDEISKNAHLYVAAAIRRYGVVAALKTEVQKQIGDDVATRVPETNSEAWYKLLDTKLLSSPSIETILRAGTEREQADMVLVEKSTSASDFITGLVELNRFTPLQSLSLQERRKALFGSDSLLS